MQATTSVRLLLYALKGRRGGATRQSRVMVLSRVRKRSGVQRLLAPRFVLKFQFGLTNRPSRTYEELVARYLKALGNNKALAPKRFAPKSLPFSSREKEFKAYQKSVKRLVSVAQKCTEEELDKYVIPHPLIGKLTLREMLFFCVYHVQHHNKLTRGDNSATTS